MPKTPLTLALPEANLRYFALDWILFCFVLFFCPGDPVKKSLSFIHLRLCTSFCASAERRLGVNLAPSI